MHLSFFHLLIYFLNDCNISLFENAFYNVIQNIAFGTQSDSMFYKEGEIKIQISDFNQD